MDRLKDGQFTAKIRARRHAQSSDQSRCKVAHNVAKEVGEHQNVVFVGPLDQLHAHIVHDAIVELDVRVLLGHLAGNAQEESVCRFEDVGLVDCGHQAATVGSGILEGKAHDPLACPPGDDPDRLCCFVGDDVVLDARIQTLGVLTDDHQVHVFVANRYALQWSGPAGGWRRGPGPCGWRH